jgi:hypothetical protein
MEINISLHHLCQPGISDAEAFKTAELDFEQDTKRLEAGRIPVKDEVPTMGFDCFYEVYDLCAYPATTRHSQFQSTMLKLETCVVCVYCLFGSDDSCSPCSSFATPG